MDINEQSKVKLDKIEEAKNEDEQTLSVDQIIEDIEEKNNTEESEENSTEKNIPENKVDTNDPQTEEKLKQLSRIFSSGSIQLSLDKITSIKPIILENIISITNTQLNSNTHISNIIYIIKKLNDSAFKKVDNTLNLSKRFIQYFKDITTTYEKFSAEISKWNVGLAASTQDTILNDNINIMIEKTQEAIASKFISFSTILKTSIINKGPFVKVKELETRLAKIIRDISASLKKVELKKEKNAKRFEKFNPIFESIKASYDKDNALLALLEKNEIYLIEVQVMNSVGKMYNRLKDFITLYKTSMNDMKLLVLEFMKVIKDTVELYMNENKKIFSDTTYNNFDTMKKFYESLDEEHLNTSLYITNIIGETDLEQFDEMLKVLQNTLVRFSTIRHISNDELLNNDELFKINRFKSIEAFIDFIAMFTPKNLSIADKDAERSPLLQLHEQVKRDPGVFSSWKNCHVVITIQESLILFDEKITKRPVESFKLKKIKVKHAVQKKTPYRFELSEKKKFMFFNTNANVIIDPVTKDRLDNITGMIYDVQKYD
jgi:hypothetical protein